MKRYGTKKTDRLGGGLSTLFAVKPLCNVYQESPERLFAVRQRVYRADGVFESGVDFPVEFRGDGEFVNIAFRAEDFVFKVGGEEDERRFVILPRLGRA